MAGTEMSKPLTRMIPSGLDGEMIEIDTYQELHWPQSQQLVAERYPLNPTLRHWFDQTPNAEREALELTHWWDLPYILTDSWEDHEAVIRDHQARMRAEGYESALSADQVEAQMPARRAEWFQKVAIWYTLRGAVPGRRGVGSINPLGHRGHPG
jgi:hypothetical protein